MTNFSVHRLKFGVWNFARKHPTIGQPIRQLGQWSTAHVREHFRRKLQGLGSRLLPADRYQRSVQTEVQLALVCAEGVDHRGIVQLLNHLRIPYVNALLNDSQRPIPYVFTIVCGDFPHELRPPGNTLHLTAETCTGLLPWNEGLRSSLSAEVIARLCALTYAKPLITGMLPAYLALRLDDVEAVGAASYLPAMLRHGWRPNLGIFIKGFEHYGRELAADIANYANQGLVETSPHAFAADDFIFFDYPHGRPFTASEFEDRWISVAQSFLRWKFPVSESINAHFHAMSASAIAILAEAGVKWNFSELAPDSMTRRPAATYLPTGDPTLTTGQSAERVRSIYAGDTAQDCNQPHSYYDFLMGSTGVDDVDTAAKKITDRLALSVQTGFPAFVTTHEYLLSRWSPQGITRLFNRVDEGLVQLQACCPEKTSLSAIGRVCGDHTDVMIESINECGPSEFRVNLSGSCAGHGILTVIWREQRHYLNIPAFSGKTSLEIKL